MRAGDLLAREARALEAAGAEAIVLGCTEIELIAEQQQHVVEPLLPMTRPHAEAAVDWSLAPPP